MSDADSTSRRRPPTIDLTAKEVASAGPDRNRRRMPSQAGAECAGQLRPRQPEPHPAGRRGTPSARCRCASAPPPSPPHCGLRGRAGSRSAHAAERRRAAACGCPPARRRAGDAKRASDRVEEISGRLDRIEQALQGPPRTDAALAGRVAGAEAQAKALGDSLAALTRRVDELAAAAQTALAQAKLRGCADAPRTLPRTLPRTPPSPAAEQCAAKRHRSGRKSRRRACKAR